MTFGVDDYEKAIARIFDAQGNVVGTGFLVAPGYVLTCAHVVLQAIGTNFDAENYDAAVVPVGNIITLDFPMANGAPIQAEVLNAWRPYRINGDDIAGLKLLAVPPQQSRPMPMLRCSCADIQNQRHAVYGFANDNGDRTDAYKPKSNAPGGRFQLCKAGDDSLDETIEAGFSGAPVWNYDRGGVIGMVATAALAKDHRSKAYAISVDSLHPVIQELFAHSLHDCIRSHLLTARSQVQNAIKKAFWLCDSDGNSQSSNDLLDRLLHLTKLPNRQWQQHGEEIDRLTQFAMFLVIIDGLPQDLVNQITDWVKFCKFDFDALYVKANRYRQERDVSAKEASVHLIVQITPDEQDAEKMSVSIWAIDDGHDLLQPPPPLVQDRDVVFTQLPSFLENWLEEESALADPMIHCFVARHRLGCDLDACETESGLTLGKQYKLVMRTDLNQSPTGQQYHKRWRSKWQSLESKLQSTARETFVRSDCRDKNQLFDQLRLAETAILENLGHDRVDEVFKFIAKKVALPVALWVRQDDLAPELDRILDCSIIDLPERILAERIAARDDTPLGNHLSLVWEDPNVIPPTWEPLSQ